MLRTLSPKKNLVLLAIPSMNLSSKYSGVSFNWFASASFLILRIHRNIITAYDHCGKSTRKTLSFYACTGKEQNFYLQKLESAKFFSISVFFLDSIEAIKSCIQAPINSRKLHKYNYVNIKQKSSPKIPKTDKGNYMFQMLKIIFQSFKENAVHSNKRSCRRIQVPHFLEHLIKRFSIMHIEVENHSTLVILVPT